MEDDEGADDVLDALLHQQLGSLFKPQTTSKPGVDEDSTTADEDSATRPNHQQIVLPAWRQIAVNVVTHRDFESVIILLTVVNCFALALYTPLEPPTSLPNVLMERIGLIPTPLMLLVLRNFVQVVSEIEQHVYCFGRSYSHVNTSMLLHLRQ